MNSSPRRGFAPALRRALAFRSADRRGAPSIRSRFWEQLGRALRWDLNRSDEAIYRASAVKVRSKTDDPTPHPVASGAANEHLAVLSFDLECTDRSDAAQPGTALRDAVEQAFERADLAEAWAGRVFAQYTADGFIIGLESRELPRIIDRVPSALQADLRELHRQGGPGLRVRMGVSCGPVHNIRKGSVEVAVNRAVIDACRIADSEPTRLLLRHSDPEATYLVLALTDAVMDAIATSDSMWLKQSEFVKTDIAITAKHYRIASYLHVPTISGALLRSGLIHAIESSTPDRTWRAPLESRVERMLSIAYTTKQNAATGKSPTFEADQVYRRP